jgi:hypothetical protein
MLSCQQALYYNVDIALFLAYRQLLPFGRKMTYVKNTFSRALNR